MPNVPPATRKPPPPQAPRWPVAVLGFCAVMATLSLLQGIVDLVIPTLTGGEPFGFLFQATERYGEAFLVAYIFIHNLGLACLVPGVGFIAAWFERKTVNRGHIGVLLAGSVVLSLLVALQYMLQARERFDLLVALPIYLAEALAVLALAIVGARELRGFVPTPRYEWSLVVPFRRISRTLVGTTLVLAALAVLEAQAVLA